MILSSVLFGIFILPLREDASLPVVLPIMFIQLQVLINSEYLANVPSSSTRMNATLLSVLRNVVTSNLRISRGRRLIMDGNPKGYEVAEHISKKVEVNPQMLSILKNANSI